MAKYTVGTLVTLQAEFYDNSGTLADPDEVTCEYSPAGSQSVTSLDTTKVSTGIYAASLDTTGMSRGIVIYEFFGTGAVQSCAQNQIELDELPF